MTADWVRVDQAISPLHLAAEAGHDLSYRSRGGFPVSALCPGTGATVPTERSLLLIRGSKHPRDHLRNVRGVEPLAGGPGPEPEEPAPLCGLFHYLAAPAPSATNSPSGSRSTWRQRDVFRGAPVPPRNPRTGRRYGHKTLQAVWRAALDWSYPGSIANLNAYSSATRHIVQFSDENGVDRALPASIAASIKQAVEAGHGEEDLSAVFEILRKNGSGGATK
jgi:hypothetical protein